jgi:hypothetical protein
VKQLKKVSLKSNAVKVEKCKQSGIFITPIAKRKKKEKRRKEKIVHL